MLYIKLCSDELYSPFDQSGVVVAGATNAVNTRQSEVVPASLIFSPPSPSSFLTPPLLPTQGIRSHRETKVATGRTQRKTHGKIGGCEQSKKLFSFNPSSMFEVTLIWLSLLLFNEEFFFFFDHDIFILD